jgi:hypothetical protein
MPFKKSGFVGVNGIDPPGVEWWRIGSILGECHSEFVGVNGIDPSGVILTLLGLNGGINYAIGGRMPSRKIGVCRGQWH